MGTNIWTGICISPSSSPVENFGYYPYRVNAGISRQNGDGFGWYPRMRVCLSYLRRSKVNNYRVQNKIFYRIFYFNFYEKPFL